MHNAIHGVTSAEESTVKPTMDDKDQLQSTNPSKGMLYIVYCTMKILIYNPH